MSHESNTPSTRWTRARRGSRTAGMTLVEMMASVIVLVIAVGGLLGSLSSFAPLADSTWEISRAQTAAQQMIERMRSEEFSQLFARFNTVDDDDPAGVASPGPDFVVDGLDPRKDDGDGAAGVILFPVDPEAPGVLREDLENASFGFPRDLNGDGAQDSVDHAGDYMVLPVRVRIEWRGRSGNSSYELQTVLRGS